MMVKIELLYRMLVKDKNGKVVKCTPWVNSKSFVFQFLQIMNSIWRYAYVGGGKDTSGVAQTIDHINLKADNIMNINGGDNASSLGIVVGTGTTAPTNTDYALEAQIAQGTGDGQLDYGATSFTNVAVVGVNVDVVVSRAFYNGSGDTITVNEIGIYAKSVYRVNAVGYFCIVRDVLAAGVDVLDTQTLTVQYTLRTTV